MKNFTSQDIRAECYAALIELKAGRMTPQAAIAFAKLAHTIVDSARADLEASRFLSGSQRTDDGQLVPLRLGRSKD